MIQLRATIGIALLGLVCACQLRAAEVTADDGERVVRLMTPQLLQFLPSLKLGAVHCPNPLQLGDQHHDRCTWTLGDRDFAVDIWRDAQSGQLAPTLQATMIDVGALEQYRQPGASAAAVAVDCGQPKRRLFAVGDVIACKASKPGGWSHMWKLEVENLRGRVTFPNGYPNDVEAKVSPLMKRLTPLLAQPTRILDQADGEALLRELLGPTPRHHFDKFHCPPKLDLSDGRWELCTAALDGTTPVRVRVEATTVGWQVRPDQATFDVSDAEQAATESAVAKVRAHGVTEPLPDVRVSCSEKGLIVRDFPVHLQCVLATSATTHEAAHIYIDGVRPPQAYFYFGDPTGEANENADGRGGTTLAAATATQTHDEAKSRATAAVGGTPGATYFWHGWSDRLNRGVAVSWVGSASMAQLSAAEQTALDQLTQALSATTDELLVVKRTSGTLIQTGSAYIYVKDHTGRWRHNEDRALEQRVILAGY